MGRVVKAGDSREFLGYVPQLCGYQPQESIVIVPFKQNRTIGAMRTDLPPNGNELAAAISLTEMIARIPGMDAIAAVVYTGGPHERAVPILEAIGVTFGVTGVEILDLLYVADDGWGSLSDENAPHDGELPYEVTMPDQLTGVELPEVDSEFARLVQLGEFDIDTVESVIELYEDALNMEPSALSVLQAVQLINILNIPATRDIALLQWTLGREYGVLGLAAQVMWDEGDEYPDSLAAVMMGEAPRRPDSDRLTRGLDLVRYLLALAPNAGLYSMAAWLSWALGRSTHAMHYAEWGLQMEPGHGFSEIVFAFVMAGMLPDWAFTTKEDDDA